MLIEAITAAALATAPTFSDVVDKANEANSDAPRVCVQPVAEYVDEEEFETPIGRVRELTEKIDALASRVTEVTPVKTVTTVSKLRAVVYFLGGFLAAFSGFLFYRFVATMVSTYKTLKRALEEARKNEKSAMEPGGGNSGGETR